MNSTFLRVLAVAMVVGAIAAAWVGYRISAKPPTGAVKVAAPTYTQIVAAQAIPAGKILTANDVEAVSTPRPDARGYTNVHDVLGKLTVEAIPKGMPLISPHFPVLGPLAQSLAPDERAIAVKVNEVIGVGGFVKPGDRVDVLLYLRADRETDNVSSAQIVLRDVKVLAYGEMLGEQAAATSGQSSTGIPSKGTGIGENMKKTDPKKEKDSRSAILAVPENEISRLMLAESSGTLRLALRGAQPVNSASARGEANQFIKLNEVARLKTERVAAAGTPLQSVVNTGKVMKKKNVSAISQRERVIVHRGEQVEVMSLTK